jgi:hypothetical protein
MDLTKLTTEELKALAYDNIVQVGILNRNIQMIEEEISKRPPTEPILPEEPKKK